MFDYHMHTTVSYDGHHSPERMLAAAQRMGLQEICFTDHIDHDLRGIPPICGFRWRIMRRLMPS